MRTVTPRISSDDVEGRRVGCGAAAVKSNELTPTGTGPTIVRQRETTEYEEHEVVKKQGGRTKRESQETIGWRE
jgi:hypothetical protein